MHRRRFWAFIQAGLLLAAAGHCTETETPSEEEMAPSVTSPATPENSNSGTLMIVSQPWTDLRRSPMESPLVDSIKTPYDKDSQQETQLLFGEVVRVVGMEKDWAQVNALEQMEFTHNNVWEGYPGWVKSSALLPYGQAYAPNAVVKVRFAKLYSDKKQAPSYIIPLGSRLQVNAREGSWSAITGFGPTALWIRSRDIQFFSDAKAKPAELRRAIIKTAKLFLHEPYFWGGRTPHDTSWHASPTGIDCSALVHLAYRVQGVSIPRDAHEQYLASRPIEKEELLPGDLLFLAAEDAPNKMTHVMIYLGDDKIIEAVHEFDIVRITTIKNKLGKALNDIRPLEPVSHQVIYRGRLLKD